MNNSDGVGWQWLEWNVGQCVLVLDWRLPVIGFGDEAPMGQICQILDSEKLILPKEVCWLQG